MALTKLSVVDKVEVLENGNIQVRTATRIVEDGEVISSAYHRNVLNPADDLTGQDPKVVAIANATWTPEVIAAYQAQQEADQIKSV
jgi:hypothetical protein